MNPSLSKKGGPIRTLLLICAFLFALAAFPHSVHAGRLLSPDEKNILLDGLQIYSFEDKKIIPLDVPSCGSDHNKQAMWPDWSPDGKQIVFALINCEENGVYRDQLWIMDVPQKKARKINTLGSDHVFHPLWSKDGKYLAWTDAGRIWIADANGLNVRRWRPGSNDYETAFFWTKENLLGFASGVGSEDLGPLRLGTVDAAQERFYLDAFNASNIVLSANERYVYYNLYAGPVMRVDVKNKLNSTVYRRPN